jgi:hypothetical protein
MLNDKLYGYMCELFSIGVKSEPAIKFVTDFWDNPRIYIISLKCGNQPQLQHAGSLRII